MAQRPWDRRRPAVRDRERDRLLAEWLNREVVPFSLYWRERLSGLSIGSAEQLAAIPFSDEVELASAAGGPGNPALLLRPTEEQFKRNVSRRELMAAAREVRRGDGDGRSAVLFRRFQPVHVHEAGIAAVLAIAYTRTDLDRLHLAGARLVEVLGLGADDVLVNGVAPGPSVHFWGLYHAALAARMPALHPRTSGEDAVAAVRRGLAMLPATVVALPLAEAERVLEGLISAGVHAPRLRTILTVGAAPSGDSRERLIVMADELGATEPVRVQAVWAPASARALWGECRPPREDPHEATYGFHTYPDMEYCEVRDVETDQSAEEAAPGELVLTNFGWRGTALVRLATGAYTGGLTSTAPCPACRRTVPRLAPDAVEGAWQPRLPDGQGRRLRVDIRRAPAVLRAERLAAVGVRDWSMRVDGDHLVLRLDGVRGEVDRDGLVGLIGELGEVVGTIPEVHMDRAGAAQRPRLGGAGTDGQVPVGG